MNRHDLIQMGIFFSNLKYRVFQMDGMISKEKSWIEINKSIKEKLLDMTKNQATDPVFTFVQFHDAKPGKV